MKLRVFLWITLLVAVFALAVYAADVSGKWIAQVPGRGGETREVTFNFKADGETLTGTMSSPQGDREISDGKIKGDDISFTMVMRFRDNEMKMLYKGKVSGDEIKFTRTVEGGPEGMPRRAQEFTAKRAGS